jgi:hypothetical protein
MKKNFRKEKLIKKKKKNSLTVKRLEKMFRGQEKLGRTEEKITG